MNHFQTHLAHLAEMARNPASKAHACWRALELDRDNSGLFTGMKAALMREVPGLDRTMEVVGREMGRR
jgi:hypothetical protein